MKINTDKPYEIFAEVLEQTALDQFESAMNQHFVVRGALMPDAHAGYSLPIGAVVETSGFVVPAWVGYDIGCGVCAMRTGFNVHDVKKHSLSIFNTIHNTIPTGFAHHKEKYHWATAEVPDICTPTTRSIYNKNGGNQLGTLGGGNHFIEIGADENDNVWIIIHSGSRGIGHAVATHYMKLASGDGKAREGHFGFDIHSQNGKDYLLDMEFCLLFALENRARMVDTVLDCIGEYCEDGSLEMQWINRNHNHAEVTINNTVVHRKGATHAEAGMFGVIPGNMRDGSFIVVGKGNDESLCSSSHGAGRVLGRKEASKVLDVSEFEATMSGVVAKVGTETLDESPFAYKDIFDVMKQQESLVEVVNHIKPIINIKGV